MSTAGCEERRRNHSCPIPCLDAPFGSGGIDSADDSTPASGCRIPGGGMSRRRGAVRPLRTRTRNPSYRSMETSRLQECSWQVWLLVGFGVSYERALRRTSLKVQTVKAGHPQKIQDSIPCFLRAITPDERFSGRVPLHARPCAASGLRGDRPCLCRGQ